MKEYTITYKAEITRIIKSDADNMEQFLINDVPKFICEDIKRKLPADDVNVKDYNVKVRDYKVFVRDEAPNAIAENE